MKRKPAALFLLFTVLAVSPAATAAEPLTGIDPVSGNKLVVEPDGPLTHLVFFATWCPPCLAEFRALADLEARWQPDGYRLVLVAIPQREDAARLARFMSDESPPGQILFDRTGALQSRFGIDAVPGHVLLGPDGAERFRAGSLDEGVIAAVRQQFGSR